MFRRFGVVLSVTHSWRVARDSVIDYDPQHVPLEDAIQRYTAEGREAFFSDSKTQDAPGGSRSTAF